MCSAPVFRRHLTQKDSIMKPTIALVGRPNVGKSTLFNRLTRTKDALVHDLPGLTRDRHYGHGKIGSKPYLVIDTGGFEPVVDSGILHEMAKQTLQAVDEADAVVFLVDGRTGLTPQDKIIADRLRQSPRPVYLAVNKGEGGNRAVLAAEFYELALGDPYVISGAHGDGVYYLIEDILETFPEPEKEEEEAKHPVFAVIGRPNVGKSSLVNALLGEERVIVSDVPGTTRDTIEEYADIGGVPLRIIDTAGIRATEDAVERIGVDKARAHVKSAALVLALFDGSRPLEAEDEEILALLEGKDALIVVTKSDLPRVLDIERLQNLVHLPLIEITTKEEEGLSPLTAAILEKVYDGEERSGEGSFVADLRTKNLLEAAADHLSAAISTMDQGLGLDFISIDLRSSLEKLGEITGETVGDDVLDEIFSRFCVGK